MFENVFRTGFGRLSIHSNIKQTCSTFSRRICMASAAAFISITLINDSTFNSYCQAVAMKRITPAITVKDSLLLERLRPSNGEYNRIDEIHLSKKENQEWLNDHAIHGQLNKDTGIEVYEIYKCNNSDELLCIIKFGSSLNGYPGVVHGGITGLMFDNSFGWLLLSSKAPPAVTANLNINYRKPIFPNSFAVLKAKFDTTNKRKIYLSATLHDSDGALLADSTALFIKMR